MAGRSEPLTGGQFLGSLLLILLGVLAIALLGALSCSLACEGNEAGAVIILLIGLPAIIFLVVRGIRKITNQQPKKKSKEATQ